MEKKYQVTLYDKGGHYRPVSTIVVAKEGMDIATIKNKGIIQICQKRLWTTRELKKYNYLTMKIREVKENGTD